MARGISLSFNILTDEARKSIESFSGNLKVVDANLKAVNEVLKGSSTTMTDYARHIALLDDKKNTLTSSIEDNKKQLQQLENAGQGASEEAESLRIEIAKQEQQLAKTNNEITKTNKKMDQLEQETRETGDQIEEATEKTSVFADVLKANLASAAIIGGLKAIADGVQTVVKAIGSWSDSAQDLQLQQTRLEQIKRNVIGATDEEVESINNLISAQENLGVVSRTAQTSALGQVATFVSSKESLEALLPAMNDLIVHQKGVDASADDARKVAQSLGMALDGNYRRLQRDGIALTETQRKMIAYGDESQRVAALTEAIGHSVGGMNEAMAKTDAGQIAQMQTYFENARLSAGQMFNDFRNGVVAQFLPAVQNIAGAIKGIFDGSMSAEEGMRQIRDGLLSGLDTIKNILPDILSTGITILKTLLEGIIEMIPYIMPVVVDIINALITTIIHLLPQLLQAGITVVLELVRGISQALPQLIPTIIDAIFTIIKALIDNIGLLIQAGIEIIFGLIEGIVAAIPKLVEMIPVIILSIIDAIVNNIPMIIEAGITLFVSLVKNLPRIIVEIVRAIPQIIVAIVQGVGKGVVQMARAGLDLIRGLWQGIRDARAWIMGKIRGFMDNILGGIRSFFGINSPSTVFRDEIGLNLGLGLAEGIKDSAKYVEDAVGYLEATTLNAMNDSYLETLNPFENQDLWGRLETEPNYYQIIIQPQSMSEEDLETTFDFINRKFGDI